MRSLCACEQTNFKSANYSVTLTQRALCLLLLLLTSRCSNCCCCCCCINNATFTPTTKFAPAANLQTQGEQRQQQKQQFKAKDKIRPRGSEPNTHFYRTFSSLCHFFLLLLPLFFVCCSLLLLLLAFSVFFFACFANHLHASLNCIIGLSAGCSSRKILTLFVLKLTSWLLASHAHNVCSHLFWRRLYFISFSV